MIATRPRRHGKRAFLAALLFTCIARGGVAQDPGWRLVVIPAFERPALHAGIPGSRTAIVAVARPAPLGLFEYATTRGAMRWAGDLAREKGEAWLAAADIKTRRDRSGVIDRIVIEGKDPALSSLALTPAFYRHFEPLLGDGFHVIIPHRNMIALYPRLAGKIPPEEASTLLLSNLTATFPVSREVFRGTPDGLVADGILTDE